MADVQILSVLDKIRRDRRPDTRAALEEEKGPKFLLDTQVINDIVDREMEKRLLDPERAKKCAGFRTWVKDWRTPYDGLIGNVDEEGLVSHVAAAIQGQLDTIRNAQNNGDWRPMAYERTTVKMDGITYMRVGVLWVDVLGKDDQQYIDGRPSSSVKVNVQTQALPAELVDLLRQNAGGGAANDAMAAFLQAQTRLMNAQAAALEGSGAKAEASVEPPADDPEWTALEEATRPKRGKLLGDALKPTPGGKE
jgi:hypothetical protein